MENQTEASIKSAIAGHDENEETQSFTRELAEIKNAHGKMVLGCVDVAGQLRELEEIEHRMQGQRSLQAHGCLMLAAKKSLREGLHLVRDVERLSRGHRTEGKGAFKAWLSTEHPQIRRTLIFDENLLGLVAVALYLASRRQFSSSL